MNVGNSSDILWNVPLVHFPWVTLPIPLVPVTQRKFVPLSPFRSENGTRGAVFALFSFAFVLHFLLAPFSLPSALSIHSLPSHHFLLITPIFYLHHNHTAHRLSHSSPRLR